MNRHITLTVIVPVYNEEATVEVAVRRLREVGIPMEVVAIDDASTDGTAEILEGLREEGLVDRLIRQPRNRGKGAAVRAGIEAATGEVLVVQDADLEYDPFDLPILLEPIRRDRADAVYGSRFLGSARRVLYFWHSLGNRTLTLVSNMFTNLNLTDMETCYKMIRTDLARSLPLRSDRFGIEPEITAKLAQAGARIYEVPINYFGRTYREGKKIGWKDGIAAFWHILRFNLLTPRPDRLAYRPHGTDLRSAHPGREHTGSREPGAGRAVGEG